MVRRENSENSIPIKLIGKPEVFQPADMWQWQAKDFAISILVKKDIWEKITKHARSKRNREVGGVLVGEVNRVEGSYQIRVTDFIAAEFAIEESTQMKFTHETWREIDKELKRLETQKTDRKIVGWFHTHPGWKIFLSDKDLYIHRNFFKEAWQIALVIDPKAGTGGFFRWENGQISEETSDEFYINDIDTPSSGKNIQGEIHIKLEGVEDKPHKTPSADSKKVTNPNKTIVATYNETGGGGSTQPNEFSELRNEKKGYIAAFKKFTRSLLFFFSWFWMLLGLVSFMWGLTDKSLLMSLRVLLIVVGVGLFACGAFLEWHLRTR